MSKLRADFVVGTKGIELVAGDVIEKHGIEFTVIEQEAIIHVPLHKKTILKSEIVAVYCQPNFIVKSFAPRKNTGEQPCGDDVPVDAFSDMFVSRKGVVSCFEWLGNGSWVPKSWRPDLEALIKMQAEHDKAATEQPKTEQLIYTPEIALTHGKPEPDMLCRVEHGVALDDDIKINTVTFKFETDSEICVLDKDGHIDAIDKEWFIAFHPISTKKELEIAKEKQIDRLLAMVDFIGGDTTDNRARLEYLQYNNELPEIILPLEK